MKFVRVMQGTQERYGILEGDNVKFIKGSIFDEFDVTAESAPLTELKLVSPCMPSKAVCVGANYHDHCKEMNFPLPQEPLIFLKPPTSVCNPGDIVDYPMSTNNLHFEAELAVVIKKVARRIPEDKVYDYILGYTCANDVTLRDVQFKYGQWTQGKAQDDSLPLGPCIETELDPSKADIRLYLNGKVLQNSNTKELVFSIPQIMSHITQFITLLPGDVVLTGTPAGVGPMQIGDRVVVEIEGIGRLENVVGRL